MNMLARFSSILLAIFLTACTVEVGLDSEEDVHTGTSVQQDEIRAATKAVAAMYDEHRFMESWSLVGPLLQSQTTQEAWARHVTALRKPLGNAGRRTIEGFGFPTEMDGAPTGQYGLIGVRTDFANAKAVEEKFVFQLVGREWKLVGYWLSKTYTLGPQH